MRGVVAFLTWGLLVGLQHALEPDHLAAVSSLASRHRSPRTLSAAGLFWGIGHAIPLVLLGALALLAHATIPARLSVVAELAVGVMLVVLGARVLSRLARERIHLHVHRHADGTLHAHAHSHRHGQAHDAHEHAPRLRWRSSALVGMTHGTAGSAALVVMAAASARSAWSAMAFVLLFASGAMLGMAALGAIVSVPARLGLMPERGTRLLHLAVGCLTVAIGVHLLGVTGGALLLGR